MSKCIHEKVCKHFNEDEVMECSNQNICKHMTKDYADADVDTKPVTGLKAAKKILRAHDKKDDVDPQLDLFKKAKVFLALNMHELDDNQKKAVETFKGKYYSSVSVEQRQQLINIAADVKRMKAGE